MAQREVLASFDIDEAEAAAALRNLGTQLTAVQGGAQKTASTIEHEFDRAGPAFVHHMFSMRAAAAALLGGFSLAGIVTELASLTKGLIEASPAFENTAKSAALLKEELLGFGDKGAISAALQDTTAWMDRLSASIEHIKEIAGSLPGTPDERIGFVGKILFGAAGDSWVPEAIHLLGELLEKINAAQMAAIQKNRAVGGAPSPFLMEEWQKNIKEHEEGLAALEKGINFGTTQFSTGFKVIDGVLTDTSILTTNLTGDINDLHMSLGGLSEGIANAFNDKPIKEWNLSTHQALTQTSVAVTAASEAFMGLAGALSQAISQGGNGRELMRGVMEGLSAAMFAKSAEYLAYALAATTPIGAATLGATPPQFAAIAGEFAAVGLVAGLAARGIGGGNRGHSGSAGGASGGVGGGLGTSERSISVQINFDGATVLGGSADELSRQIVALVRTGLMNGANGGAF